MPFFTHCFEQTGENSHILLEAPCLFCDNCTREIYARRPRPVSGEGWI